MFWIRRRKKQKRWNILIWQSRPFRGHKAKAFSSSIPIDIYS